MTTPKHHRLIILGSGPAGYTAAIYAARANLNPAIITGTEQGGQLIKTPIIENWPGTSNEISGIDLMENMMKQAQHFNVITIQDQVSKVNLSNHPFHLQSENNEYTCDALIIATGSSVNFLNLPTEQKYLGKGVSTCATCDGFFYKNKKVVVIGGGNTMATEALYLANIASEVTIVHRKDSFRADPAIITRLKNISNIKFAMNCIVTEILGNELEVTGLKIKDVSSATTKKIEASGIFIAIGHKPNTEIFTDQLAMDQGYIKTGFGTLTTTNIPGVFAAGDVMNHGYHQAIIAAGFGSIAALDAKNFLNSL